MKGSTWSKHIKDWGLSLLLSLALYYFIIPNSNTVREKMNQEGYKYYVVNKTTGRILTGWEYKQDAIDFQKEMTEHNSRMQLKVYTKIYLMAQGLDPDSNENWSE